MTSPIQVRIPVTLQKVLLICGIIASLLYGAIDILGGMVWHGYSFASQAISELTAIGAPTRQLLAPLYPIYSLLMIAFGLGVLILAGQRRMLALHWSLAGNNWIRWLGMDAISYTYAWG